MPFDQPSTTDPFVAVQIGIEGRLDDDGLVDSYQRFAKRCVRRVDR
jgi:hypothetical protein